MKINACCQRCESRLYAREIPIFDSLNSDELDKIIDLRKHIHLKKRETLFCEGEKLSKLYIISNGVIKITKNTSDGKEQIINILCVGDFFGETNIIGDPKPSNVSAIAVKETEICTISREDLESIIKENMSIALKLLDGLDNRLVTVENLTTNLSNNNFEVRVACMLLEFIDKYGVLDSKGIDIISLPINREEMANYCGIARETLSRKLSSLHNNGIINLNAKIIKILDKDYLENLVI